MILLIGAGAHAHVVADVLYAEGRHTEVLGVVDPAGKGVYHHAHLGDDDALPQYAGHEFIVCVGDNALRRRLYLNAIAAGLKPARAAIHPSAVLMGGVLVGLGSVVAPGVVIESLATIGENTIINTCASIGHESQIGCHTHICPGVRCTGWSTIGDEVLIGAGAVLIPRMQVDDKAQVGAGAVVTRSVPAQTKQIQRQRKRPVDVVLYAPVIGRGGVHRLIDLLWSRLIERANPAQFTFKALSNTVDEAGLPILWKSDFEHISHQTPPSHPRLFDWLLQNQNQFFERLQALKPGLVWLPHPWWTMYNNWSRIDAPVVATLHDFAFDYLPDMKIVEASYRQEALAFARVNAMTVFTSECQRNYGIAHFGFSEVKTCVVHWAPFLPLIWNPSQAEAERVRRKYNLPERYVLAFHCYGHKDPITVLKGQTEARSISPNVPPLVIGGLQTGQYRPGTRPQNDHERRVQMHISSHYRLGRDLFIVGEIPDDDIAGLYAGSSAVVTASTSESGVGATVYEAAAAGKPLIYSGIDVHNERIGEAGLRFAPGDASMLGMTLASLFDSAEHCQILVKSSAQWLQRSWDDVADDYLVLFQEALQ
jgi:sugar O-acyltransferase (sialic acid O-acetyltransferase NeuD family)